MQIGTRWKVGAEPPARLPQSVKDAIAVTEAEVGHLDTERWRWTLTWLENRPVVELDPSTGSGQAGTTIRLGQDGTVTVTREN
jgi:hypothetical protein